MTYNELITQRPWIDLVLKLFGEIAPVLVAILAIIINNWKSSRRDRINKKIDMIIKYENLLIDKISIVEHSLEELQNVFRKAMKCRDADKIKEYLNNYDLARGKVLECNVELFNYSFYASEILKENIDTIEIVEDIKKVIISMDEMVVNRFSDKILDEMSEDEKKEINKIKDDTIDIKSWLTIDIKRVMDNTFSLLK